MSDVLISVFLIGVVVFIRDCVFKIVLCVSLVFLVVILLLRKELSVNVFFY